MSTQVCLGTHCLHGHSGLPLSKVLVSTSLYWYTLAYNDCSTRACVFHWSALVYHGLQSLIVMCVVMPCNVMLVNFCLKYAHLFPESAKKQILLCEACGKRVNGTIIPQEIQALHLALKLSRVALELNHLEFLNHHLLLQFFASKLAGKNYNIFQHVIGDYTYSY